MTGSLAKVNQDQGLHNMRLRPITAGLVAAMLATPAMAAFNKSAGVTGVNNFEAPAAPGVVLYTQLDNPAGNGVPDQDFEASFDAYDSEAADDFVVPAGLVWQVSRINTVGTTGTPGGATVDVTFYNNAGTVAAGGAGPGTAVAGCSYTAVVPTDSTGSLTINLPTACNLPAGTYWVAIQTNQNFGTNGQHFWSNRTTASNLGAVWRNPGNGFATGCTAFNRQTTCGVGGGVAPDLLFSLTGTLGSPSFSSNVPVNNPWALGGLALTLLGLGYFATRRKA
jgi:hypothetical protein